MTDHVLMNLAELGTFEEALDQSEQLAKFYKIIARTVLRTRTIGAESTPIEYFFFSVIVRIQSLHDGTVREIKAENPQAALTLIRAWAEAVATILYATDTPTYVERLQRPKRESGRVSVQKIVNHASKRMPGIGAVYEQLSEIAHFGSAAFWNAYNVSETNEGTLLEWQLEPKWRDEEQALIACGWVRELAEASRHSLQEFAQAHIVGDEEE